MADGVYQRTCKKCQHTWSVPADIAEERPDVRSIAGQFTSLIGGSVQDQFALRAHYQQLGAAAKCPQCGATSFTQEKVAASTASPEQTPAAPQATPPAATAQPPQTQLYVLNQKMISLTGDLWIEDAQGHHAFEVDGQLLSLRGTHVLKDVSGQALYEISKPLAPHLHDTITITKGGQAAATVQKAVFNLAGDKFKITLASGQQLTLKGDWMDREFQVKDQAGQVVMTASRAWLSMHDAYGVQISPGFEVPLGLAIAIALERVEVQEKGESPLQNLLGGIGQF
ncbi:MAG TPA: LURP-one-related family protein [Candidatus Limnocylindrales bacterium]